jgi:hypothetical protein
MGGKQNVVLDATILSSLMACPRLSDFRFNMNLQSIHGKSNSLECGSIVHKFLEVFYICIIARLSREQAIQHAFAAAEMYIQGCRYCIDFTPTHSVIQGDEYRADVPHVCNHECVLKPECGHKINEYPGVKNTPREPEKGSYKTGWQLVLDTCDQYQKHYTSDHWVPLEVENVKGKVLYEDEEVRVLWKAKLDLVSDTNQGIFPIDHKTMKQRRDTVSLNNQFMGQCLVQETRGMFVNKIGFQTTLKPEEKFQRHMVNYSAPRLIEWQSEILPYYAKLLLMYAETGHFPPNFTHCEGKYGNCGFINVCGSDPGMREEEIKLNFYVGPPWNPTNDDD